MNSKIPIYILTSSVISAQAVDKQQKNPDSKDTKYNKEGDLILCKGHPFYNYKASLVKISPEQKNAMFCGMENINNLCEMKRKALQCAKEVLECTKGHLLAQNVIDMLETKNKLMYSFSLIDFRINDPAQETAMVEDLKAAMLALRQNRDYVAKYRQMSDDHYCDPVLDLRAYIAFNKGEGHPHYQLAKAVRDNNRRVIGEEVGRLLCQEKTELVLRAHYMLKAFEKNPSMVRGEVDIDDGLLKALKTNLSMKKGQAKIDDDCAETA